MSGNLQCGHVGRPRPRWRDAPPPTLEEVSDGVFAYVQLDGSWCLNNTGFLVGRDGVTAIDTCATEGRTRAFLEALSGVTTAPGAGPREHAPSRRPHPRQLAAARRHGCRPRAVPARGAHDGFDHEGPVAVGRVGRDRGVAAVRHVRRSPLGVGRRARGRRCSTSGPRTRRTTSSRGSRIARCCSPATCVFNGGTPFVVMGSVAGSLDSVERLRAFGATTVVPGHGSVCGPEVFDQLTRYFEFVQAIAREGKAAGLSPLDAALADRPRASSPSGTTASASSATCTARTPSSTARSGERRSTWSPRSPTWSRTTAASRFVASRDHTSSSAPRCLSIWGRPWLRCVTVDMTRRPESVRPASGARCALPTVLRLHGSLVADTK